MGIATSPQQPILSNSKFQYSINLTNLDKYYSNNNNSGINSMSQDYHHQAASGIFNYSNGFERSTVSHQDHVAQQIRRDKLRLQGFEGPPTPLVGLDEESGGLDTVYETAGMLSEMFNFPQGGGPTTASELLEQQTLAAHQSYRNSTAQHPRVQQQQPPPPSVTEWLYGSSRQFVGGVGSNLNDSKSQNSRDHDQSAISHHHHHHHQQQQQQTHHHHHQISSINADTATAMPFFLMNPQPRSPSPPSHHHHQISNTNNSSTLHMLLPNPSVSIEGFTTPTANTGESNFGQFTWVPDHNSQSHHQGVTTTTGAQLNNPIHEIGGVVEGQGLSLSLSSSLQHLEAAKAEELRNMGDGGLLYYNPYKNNLGSTSSNSSHSQALHNLQAGVLAQNHQVHIGFGSSLGAVNVLRNSKYVKAAQELLEEFCSVGRGQFKKNKFGRQNTNPNSSNVVVCGSSSSSKESPPLTASDRIEHQRRKVKLLSMLDEVDRRYNHYCEQMQMVVNSFDLVMGFGAAIPYTALAQKAMSRHFRCLKDAISAQLKHSCDLLGEKDGAGSSGITKGETPRLKMLEQSLRQQRAFHQMGMMEQEAWRPQRGLPERSVNILRAWLFEHFLHPYPSDADKHLLARQTGLSRNQVSNWFINARVRLWKPMVEEMYQQEAKESDQEGERSSNQQQSSSTGGVGGGVGGGGGGGFAQTPTPTSTKTTITTPTASEAPPQPPNTTTKTTMPASKRSDFNAPENDPSLVAINKHHHSFSENQAALIDSSSAPNFISNKHSLGIISSTTTPTSDVAADDTCRRISMVMPDYGTISGNVTAADHHHHHHRKSPSGYGSTLISFGTTSGDVSLTLGLHHAGNIPDNSSSFSVRDFGG